MEQISYENQDKKFVVTNKPKRKGVLGYVILLFVIVMILGGILSLSTIKKIDTIKTNETGEADFKVYLKENNFYNSKFLTPGMTYIASLINSVDIDFSYGTTYSDAVKYTYEYQIDAKTVVTDKYDASKVLYTKAENIVKPKKVSGNGTAFSIAENVNIDYDKYNEYLKEFRDTYGLDVSSNLTVTMTVRVIGNYNNVEVTNKSNDISLVIPLTKNTIDITMNSNRINNSIDLAVDQNSIDNRPLFYMGLIIIAVGFLSILIVIVMSIKPGDIYEAEIARLLKTYDRVIVTTSQPNINENKYENKVRVMTFEELLDVNEMTNAPILYYEVEPGTKSYFIIMNQDTLYKLTISKAYLEKHKDDKK